jgi:hypothetical protein
MSSFTLTKKNEIRTDDRHSWPYHTRERVCSQALSCRPASILSQRNDSSVLFSKKKGSVTDRKSLFLFLYKQNFWVLLPFLSYLFFSTKVTWTRSVHKDTQSVMSGPFQSRACTARAVPLSTLVRLTILGTKFSTSISCTAVWTVSPFSSLNIFFCLFLFRCLLWQIKRNES